MVTCVTFCQFSINSQQMVKNRQWNREQRQQLPGTKFSRKHQGQGGWGEWGQYTQTQRNGCQEGDFKYVLFITCHSGIQALRRRRLILFFAQHNPCWVLWALNLCLLPLSTTKISTPPSETTFTKLELLLLGHLYSALGEREKAAQVIRSRALVLLVWLHDLFLQRLQMHTLRGRCRCKDITCSYNN